MIMLFNGQLMEEEEATLPVLDHGILYGVGAFETLRTYNGRPFLIAEHLARLHAACKQMHIQQPYSEYEWRDHVQQLLHANKQYDAIIRITVTGGVKELGLRDAFYDRPNTFIFIRPLPEAENCGKKLQILSILRQVPGGTEALKTNNFLNNVLARQEIINYPAVEGLFLSPDGYVTEGITSNLFFVKGNEIYTPAVEIGILPGITREFVLFLAKQWGYTVHEGKYTLEDLKEASEIFLTNSVQGIMPVLEFENKGFTASGPITVALHEEYARHRHLRSIPQGNSKSF